MTTRITLVLPPSENRGIRQILCALHETKPVLDWDQGHPVRCPTEVEYVYLPSSRGSAYLKAQDLLQRQPEETGSLWILGTGPRLAITKAWRPFVPVDIPSAHPDAHNGRMFVFLPQHRLGQGRPLETILAAWAQASGMSLTDVLTAWGRR